MDGDCPSVVTLLHQGRSQDRDTSKDRRRACSICALGVFVGIGGAPVPSALKYNLRCTDEVSDRNTFKEILAKHANCRKAASKHSCLCSTVNCKRVYCNTYQILHAPSPFGHRMDSDRRPPFSREHRNTLRTNLSATPIGISPAVLQPRNSCKWTSHLLTWLRRRNAPSCGLGRQLSCLLEQCLLSMFI